MQSSQTIKAGGGTHGYHWASKAKKIHKITGFTTFKTSLSLPHVDE
jgi:hypothetical protein